MTIEFRCQSCNKLLRTPEGTQGKQAKCPQCGSLMGIPTSPNRPSDPFSSAPPTPPGPTDFSAPPHREGAFHQAASAAGPTTESSNPFQSPQYAGVPDQNYSPSTRGFHPSPINISEVFDRTWRIFKANLGLLLGAGTLTVIFWIVIDYAIQRLFGIASNRYEYTGVAVYDHGPQIVRRLAAGLVSQCVQAYLWMGLIALTLKIARGETSTVAEVLTTGVRYPAGIVVHLGYVVLTWIGFIMCIIPGFWLGLAFGLSLHMFIDQRTGILESFQHSYRAMQANKLVMLGLWLAMLGLLMLGVFACFVGTFVAVPFCTMLMTVAYLSATGQLARPGDQPALYMAP
jgi:uncharacterized membrane protein/phage FluMu protein Com